MTRLHHLARIVAAAAFLLSGFGIVSFGSVSSASAQNETDAQAPRYHAAMVAELQAMGIEATCSIDNPTRSMCHYTRRGRLAEREFRIGVIYRDDSDTIYMYVDRFLMAPAGHPQTPNLLQQLMHSNWEMLAGKFEWDPSDGEVRLSVTLHTDSNFDRRAFRNLLHSLSLRADRQYRELATLISQDAVPTPDGASDE